MKINIPFNKPFLCGNELKYIQEAVKSGKISGNGNYTKKSHAFFKEKYGFQNSFLTTSCTDALEMASILANISDGDEVIVPSFTFVSSANAFILRNSKIVFADSNPDNPNIDVEKIEELITEKTKAIVPVHYAGIACNMGKIMELSKKHNLLVIEDAAQSIDSFYKNTPLGSIGDFGAFSFHETKNIISGEGGMLVVNNQNFVKRAEIIWEKGTNRSAFFRGEIDKYSWIDKGSSFLPSEIIAAFLYAQLEKLRIIQKKRIDIWKKYFNALKPLELSSYIKLPKIPEYATLNGHMFYFLCNSEKTRNNLIEYLKKKGILSVFHYISLHKSVFYNNKHDGRELYWSDFYSDHLLRLPLYYELKDNELDLIVNNIFSFFKSK